MVIISLCAITVTNVRQLFFSPSFSLVLSEIVNATPLETSSAQTHVFANQLTTHASRVVKVTAEMYRCFVASAGKLSAVFPAAAM